MDTQAVIVDICLRLMHEMQLLFTHHFEIYAWHTTKLRSDSGVVKGKRVSIRAKMTLTVDLPESSGDVPSVPQDIPIKLKKTSAGYYPMNVKEDKEFWLYLFKSFHQDPKQWYEPIKIKSGMSIESATTNLAVASLLQSTMFGSIAFQIEKGTFNKDGITLSYLYDWMEHANQISKKSNQLFGYLKAKKQEMNRNLKNVSKRTETKKKNLQIIKELVENNNEIVNRDLIIKAMAKTDRGERTVKNMIKGVLQNDAE